jgi:hypothetical protein
MRRLMSKTVQMWMPAWEPLTPWGVAAFARARWLKLLLTQAVVAIVAAVVAILVLHIAWLPVIGGAFAHLPPAGEIKDGQLFWQGDNPAVLAENAFLGLGVDLTHSGQLARQSHIEIEFGREDWRIAVAPGYYVVFHYPAGGRLPLNRPELEPWWGAWCPWLLAGTATGIVVALMLSWTLLASLYCLPAWLIAFLQNRDLSLGQCWRMSGAALLPGALFLICALSAYGFGLVDLLQLAALWVLHFLIGWAYVFIAPLFFPRTQSATPRGNPFAGKPGPGPDQNDASGTRP